MKLADPQAHNVFVACLFFAEEIWYRGKTGGASVDLWFWRTGVNKVFRVELYWLNNILKEMPLCSESKHDSISLKNVIQALDSTGERNMQEGIS